MAETSARMKAALLPDRGVVKVAGDDARTFLHDLLTANVLTLTPGTARFGALLSPQGKIFTDFIIVEAPPQAGGGFFFDVPANIADPLVSKLNLYKLRSRVIIENLSEVLGVLAAWDGTGTTALGLAYLDPRLGGLGLRVMLPPHRAADAAAEIGAIVVDAGEYETHRIALAIPRGGADFKYGDAFPHEADMDQLGGVDFTKGCYVGQEVVSRMEHRGIARTRVMPVRYHGASPQPGEPITSGRRQIGTMGSASGGLGLALLRIDRMAEALREGEPLVAAGGAVEPLKPDWAHFAVPDTVKAAE
jgi:folate-binding protein YgfZ